MVNVHRDLIRNLQQWHSYYENQEVTDVLVGSDGKGYCLWDVDRFYEHRLTLPPQQATAIRLCLYENALEREAAVRMGVSPTNPVLIYATVGLTKLLALAYRDELSGYRLPAPSSDVSSRRLLARR